MKKLFAVTHRPHDGPSHTFIVLAEDSADARKQVVDAMAQWDIEIEAPLFQLLVLQLNQTDEGLTILGDITRGMQQPTPNQITFQFGGL